MEHIERLSNQLMDQDLLSTYKALNKILIDQKAEVIGRCIFANHFGFVIVRPFFSEKFFLKLFNLIKYDVILETENSNILIIVKNQNKEVNISINSIIGF